MKANKSILWFCLFWLIMVCLNFFIGLSVKFLEFDYIINNSPFGFNIGLWPILFIFLFITYFVFYFNFYKIYAIPALLLLSGISSNLLELIIFGGATDYIPVFIATVNISDIQIWTALIWINYSIWFSDSTQYIGSKNVDRA